MRLVSRRERFNMASETVEPKSFTYYRQYQNLSLATIMSRERAYSSGERWTNPRVNN
jgi:hypothetical protein